MSAVLTAPIVPVCCGARLRRIDIDTGTSSLTFTFCGKCESTRWFTNGAALSRDSATKLAGSTPGGRRGRARETSGPGWFPGSALRDQMTSGQGS
jgi:hypothetical protein